MPIKVLTEIKRLVKDARNRKARSVTSCVVCIELVENEEALILDPKGVFQLYKHFFCRAYDIVDLNGGLAEKMDNHAVCLAYCSDITSEYKQMALDSALTMFQEMRSRCPEAKVAAGLAAGEVLVRKGSGFDFISGGIVTVACKLKDLCIKHDLDLVAASDSVDFIESSPHFNRLDIADSDIDGSLSGDFFSFDMTNFKENR